MNMESWEYKVTDATLWQLRRILEHVRAGLQVKIANGWEPCGFDRGYPPDGNGIFISESSIAAGYSIAESISKGSYTIYHGGEYTLTEQDINDMRNYMQILEDKLMTLKAEEGKEHGILEGKDNELRTLEAEERSISEAERLIKTISKDREQDGQSIGE